VKTPSGHQDNGMLRFRSSWVGVGSLL